MGTVWGAYDEVLGRDVAVKEVVLPFGLTDEERDTQYKRTFREARTAARLGHPSVIAVYDVVEEDERPWIVMELVRALSLDKVIKRSGVLGWRRAAMIGRQMLGALHAAHEAGVLHRDVKPSNVLLEETPGGERAVLTDFGIATSVGDATLTMTGLVLGSPAYIAPERARGKDVGPASDLWSLGVTLYAMLHGRSPFERAEPMASLVAIISDDAPFLEQAGPLWPIIDGLLRKDPDERLTARQAALVLDDIVRTEAMAEAFTEALVLPDPVAQPADPTKALPTAAPAAATRAAAGMAEPPLPPPASPTAPNQVTSFGTMATRLGGGRNRLAWGVGALVAVILIGLLVVLLDSGGSGGAKTAPPATHRSGSPSGTPTTSAAPTVPAGFKAYSDDSGLFQTVLPDGWAVPPRRSDGQEVIQGGGGGDTRIVFTNQDDGSPAKDAVQSFVGSSAGLGGYKQLSLTQINATTAQLEYTFNAYSGPQHVLVRDFLVAGHNVQITLRTGAAAWSDFYHRMEPVLAGFRPASS